MASPLILLICVILLGSTGFQQSSFQNTGVRLIYVLFVSYYLIGLASRLMQFENSYFDSIFNLLRVFATSFIILLSVHQYLYRRLILDLKEKKVFNAIFIPVIIASLYSIYQHSLGILDLTGRKDSISYGRVRGVYGNPNTLGFVANLGLALLLYSLYKHKRWFWLKMVLIPALLYVTFLSLSRTSMITAAVLILFTAVKMTVNYLRLGHRGRWRHLLVMGIPFMIFTYIYLNFETLIIKYTKYGSMYKILSLVNLIFKGKVSNETTSGRVDVVQYGIERILEHPLFGNGLGAFRRFPEETGMTHGVHNTYLLVLGDAGIFPFIALLSLICYVLVSSFFTRKIAGLMAFGSMMVWALHNMSGHNGLEEKMHNITIMSSVMYLWYVKQKKMPSNTYIRYN